MLTLSEFFLGTIADAPVGSLILPNSKRGLRGIVASHNNEPFFVSISSEHRFHGFTIRGNTSHTGVIVPGVGVEVNETSMSEYSSWETHAGSLVCSEALIGIRTATGERGYGSSVIAKLASIPASPIEACFSKWQITLGTGADKRVLLTVDAAAEHS